MFEQSGNCGYLLKPSNLFDKTNPLFQRFDAYDKVFDGLKAKELTISVSKTFFKKSNLFGNRTIIIHQSQLKLEAGLRTILNFRLILKTLFYAVTCLEHLYWFEQVGVLFFIFLESAVCVQAASVSIAGVD